MKKIDCDARNFWLIVSIAVFRLEEHAGRSQTHYEALLSVVGCVEKLTTCGFNELPVEKTIHATSQSDFKVPTPLGRGIKISLNVKSALRDVSIQ